MISGSMNDDAQFDPDIDEWVDGNDNGQFDPVWIAGSGNNVRPR